MRLPLQPCCVTECRNDIRHLALQISNPVIPVHTNHEQPGLLLLFVPTSNDNARYAAMTPSIHVILMKHPGKTSRQKQHRRRYRQRRAMRLRLSRESLCCWADLHSAICIWTGLASPMISSFLRSVKTLARNRLNRGWLIRLQRLMKKRSWRRSISTLIHWI